MALKFSVDVRDAMLDAIEAEIGATAILRIRTGAPPANCAAVDTGSVLATLTLPADWMAAAGSGQKAKNGTWQDASADASGTAEHFRIYDSGGTICGLQGTVSITGGGGDMTVDNNVLAITQQFTVTGFTITAGNA
jgi:hypothetical protein